MAIHGVPITYSIDTAAKVASTSSSVSTGKASEEVLGFSDLLSGMVADTNNLQLSADTAVQKLATGETSDVQGVALSMAKADISFQFLMEIRNRLIDSYQEIMRMQV